MPRSFHPLSGHSERWSLSLLITWCAAAVVLPSRSDLLCFHTSVPDHQNMQTGACPWRACPLIFLTESDGHLVTNGTLTERRGERARKGRNEQKKIIITQRHVLSCDKFSFLLSNPFLLNLSRACNRDVIFGLMWGWASRKQKARRVTIVHRGLSMMEKLNDILQHVHMTALHSTTLGVQRSKETEGRHTLYRVNAALCWAQDRMSAQ